MAKKPIREKPATPPQPQSAPQGFPFMGGGPALSVEEVVAGLQVATQVTREQHERQSQQNAKMNQLQAAFQALIVCQQSETLMDILRDEGVVEQAVGIIKYVLKNGPITVRHIDDAFERPTLPNE